MDTPDRKILIHLTELDGRAVYVARDYITSIYVADGATHVTTLRDHFVVKEDPKQIFNVNVFLLARVAGLR